jgi:Zn-dependent protease
LLIFCEEKNIIKEKPKKEKKTYKSFEEIPPRDYMYFPKGTIEPSKPGEFSRLELSHIIISMTVLTLAFSFALSPNNLYDVYTRSGGFRPDLIPISIAMSFLGVLTAFFFHEMAHKFIAQKQGLWAEYRMFSGGLGLAMLLSLTIGIVFAAPGAVMFRGGARPYETGKIAISGAFANTIIALVSFLLFSYILTEDTILWQTAGFICFINAILAFFNLLPFGPLDGVKVIKWSPTLWLILLIASTTILFSIWTQFPVPT